jgi:hypothetical protein
VRKGNERAGKAALRAPVIGIFNRREILRSLYDRFLETNTLERIRRLQDLRGKNGGWGD